MSIREALLQALQVEPGQISPDAQRLADRIWMELRAEDPHGCIPTEQLVKSAIRRAFGHGQLVIINQALGRRTSRVCGCTDMCACKGGCFWVDEDLCSKCGSPS